MSYEAGSKECRHLIEAKESLLSTLDALSNIHSTDLIQIQIKEIYNKLEHLVDLIFKKLKNNNNKKIFLEKENLNKFILSLFKEN